MSHNHYGDPLAHTGVWGTPSSTANFCEEDYAVTRYIAEFINTMTNFAYIYYALKSPCRPGEKGKYLGMDAMAVSLVCVGVFSFIFHATMHFQTQFLDEMSMFLLGSALLQPIWTHGFAPATQRFITGTIISVLVVISAVYYQLKHPFIHWSSFIVMETLIWSRAMYFIYSHERSQAERSRLLKLFWKGNWTIVLGFTLWLIDLGLCPPLRGIRESVGLPWAFLFELHGWWHILTAVGAARYNELVRELCR